MSPPDSSLEELVLERVEQLLEANYLNLIREFLPSILTVEDLVVQGDSARACQLYTSLYFCYQRIQNVDRPVEIGIRIFGSEPNPRWDLTPAGLNSFASACFFAKRHALAESAYQFLSEGSDPHYASIGLTNLGLIALNRGDSDRAIILIEKSLEAENLKARQLAARMNNLAKAYAVGGRFESAIQTAERAVQLCGEQEELSLMKSVLFFSLAETHLMANSHEPANGWATRALRTFSLTGEKLRILESTFLLAYLQAVSGSHSDALATVQRALMRLEFAAPHWAANAACLLVGLGARDQAEELASGIDIKAQPNWVQHVLGDESPVLTTVPLTNSERFALFREAMKRA